MGRPRKKKKPNSFPKGAGKGPGKGSGRSSGKGPRKAKRATSSKRGAKAPVATLPSGPPRKPRKKSSGGSKPGDPSRQRLQKVLAGAGYGSRRDCEEFITEGRVEVDGEVVSKLGATVDPQKQEIRFDGDVLSKFKPIYYLVNKPSGVISTNNDPSGRMRVVDLVPDGSRLFTVGRLDKASEGLMLVTNDGELANRMAHPRYGIEKTYEVVVAGSPDASALQSLRRGIHLAEGVVRVARLTVKKRSKGSTQLEMVLTEGRNREIRRMAARIGHKVQSLKRIGMATLRIGAIPAGAYRPLTAPELKRLRALCSGKPKSRSATARAVAKSAPSRPRKSESDSAKSARSTSSRDKPAGGRKTATAMKSTAGRSTDRHEKRTGKTSGKPAGGKATGRPKAKSAGKPKGKPASKTTAARKKSTGKKSGKFPSKFEKKSGPQKLKRKKSTGKKSSKKSSKKSRR